MSDPGQEGLLSDLLPPYTSLLQQLSPEPVIAGFLLEGVSGDGSNTRHPTVLSHQQDSQPGPCRGHEAFLPQGCQTCVSFLETLRPGAFLGISQGAWLGWVTQLLQTILTTEEALQLHLCSSEHQVAP